MFRFPIENIPSNYVIQNKPNSNVVILNSVDDLLKHLYYSIIEEPYSAMNKIDPSRFTFRHNLKYKISNSEIDILENIIIRFETISNVSILLLPGVVSIFIGCNEYIDLNITNTIKTAYQTSSKYNIQTLEELLNIKTITNTRSNYLYSIINIPVQTFIKPEFINISGNSNTKLYGYIQIDKKYFIKWYKNIHSFNSLNTHNIQYHSRYDNILPDSIYNMYLSNKYIKNNVLELDISMDNSAGKIFLPKNSIFSLTNINIEWVHNTEYILPVDKLLSGLHCHDLLPSNNLQLFYNYYYKSPFLEISQKLDENQRSIYTCYQKKINCNKHLIKIPTYYTEMPNLLNKTIPNTSHVDLNHSTIFINIIVCKITRSGKYVKYIPRIPGLDRLGFSLYKCKTNIYNFIPQDHIKNNYFPDSIFKSGMYKKGSQESTNSGYNMEQVPIITPISKNDSKFRYKVSEFNFKYPDFDYEDPLLEETELFYVPKDGGGLYIPKLRIEFECEKIATNQYLVASIQLNKKIFYNTIKYCASLEDRDKLNLWLDTPCTTDRILTDKELLSIGDQRNNIEPLSLYDKAARLEPANYWFENLFPQMETYRDIEDIRQRLIKDNNSNEAEFVIKTRIQYLKNQTDDGLLRGRIFIPKGTVSLSILQSPYAYQEFNYMIYSIFSEEICLPNHSISNDDVTNKIETIKNKITGSEATWDDQPYTSYSFFSDSRTEIARFIYTRYMLMPDNKKENIKNNFISENFIDNNPIEIFKTYYTIHEIEPEFGITIPSNNNKIPTSVYKTEVKSNTSEILFSNYFLKQIKDKLERELGNNGYTSIVNLNKSGTWIYLNFYKSGIGSQTIIFDKYIFLTINSKKWQNFYYGINNNDLPSISIIKNSRFPYSHEEIPQGCMYEQCLTHNWTHDYEYCSTVECEAGGGGCPCYCGEYGNYQPAEEWIQWNPKYTRCDYESKNMWTNPCEDIINENITRNQYKYIEIVGGNRLTAHLKIDNIDKSQIESILSWFYIGDTRIEPLDDDYTITINDRTYIVDETNGAGNVAYFNKGVQEGYDYGYNAGCNKISVRVFNDQVLHSSNEFYIQGYQSNNGYLAGYSDGNDIWDINYNLGKTAGFNDGFNNSYDNQIYSGSDGFCGLTAYTTGYNDERPNGLIAKNDFNNGMIDGFRQGRIDMCYREANRPNNYIYTGSNNSYYKSGWENEDILGINTGYKHGREYLLSDFNTYYNNGFTDGTIDGTNCQLQREIPEIPDPITDEDRLIYSTIINIAYVFGYEDAYETEILNNNCYYDIGLLQGYIDGYNEGCQILAARHFNDVAGHQNSDYNDGYSVGYNETYASAIAIWDTNFTLGQNQGIIDGNANNVVLMTNQNIIEHNSDCLPSNYYNNNTKCGECVRKAYLSGYLPSYENTWKQSNNYIHVYNSLNGYLSITESETVNIDFDYDNNFKRWMEISEFGIIEDIWIKIKQINHNNPEQLQIGIEHKAIYRDGSEYRYFMLFDRHGSSGEGSNFTNTVFYKNASTTIDDNSNLPPYTGTYKPDSDPEYAGLNIVGNLNWLPLFHGVEIFGFWALHILDKIYAGPTGTAPSDVFELTIHEDKERHQAWHKYDYIIQTSENMFINQYRSNYYYKEFILKILEYSDIANTDHYQQDSKRTHLRINYEIECKYGNNVITADKKIVVTLQSPSGIYYNFVDFGNASPLINTLYTNHFNNEPINGDWKLTIKHRSGSHYTYELKAWSFEFLVTSFVIEIGEPISYITDTILPIVINDYQQKVCHFNISEYGIVKNVDIEFSIENDPNSSSNVADYDYEIFIQSIHSNRFKIVDGAGFGLGGFTDTIISDNGSTDIDSSYKPHTGKYKAHNGINIVKIKDYVNNKQLHGDWKVIFYDQYANSQGLITKCKLHFKLY